MYKKSVMHGESCCFAYLSLLPFFSFSSSSPSLLLKFPIDHEDLVRPRTGTRQLPYHLIQKKLLIACVAAGPRTRLNHTLYTEGLERLRRRLTFNEVVKTIRGTGWHWFRKLYLYTLGKFLVTACARLAWSVKAFLFISLFSITSFSSTFQSQSGD